MCTIIHTIPIGMTMNYTITYMVYCGSMDTIIAVYTAVKTYR